MKKIVFISILILSISIWKLHGQTPGTPQTPKQPEKQEVKEEAAAEKQKEPRRLVMTNVHLVDVKGKKVLKNQCIFIENDTITSIAPMGEKEIPAPDKAFVLNLKGHYVIPGLIDGHVHISHMGREETQWILSEALRGGITGIRDMAGDNRSLAGWRRDALLHEIESPYIYFCAIMGGPDFFKDPRVIDGAAGEIPGELSWARLITPSSNMPQVIAEAKGSGAVGIKVYAHLPAEQIRRICEEGHKQGLLIWSHAAVFPARPLDAVLAGVDVLSHSALLVYESIEKMPPSFTYRYKTPYDPKFLEDEKYKKLFSLMAKQGTILDPTVFLFADSIKKGAFAKGGPKMADFIFEATKMAHRYGVKIAAGTDNIITGKKEFPVLHDELEMLVNKCGLTPMDAIQAATLHNALALGIEKQTGSLEIGKRADMVILAADPTTDIRKTRSIRYVIKGGMVYVRQ
ncbi:MAG: amidohydrolase family protein [bacterium]|nr:amidohydrolase family protein [bacterium]